MVSDLQYSPKAMLHLHLIMMSIHCSSSAQMYQVQCLLALLDLLYLPKSATPLYVYIYKVHSTPQLVPEGLMGCLGNGMRDP